MKKNKMIIVCVFIIFMSLIVILSTRQGLTGVYPSNYAQLKGMIKNNQEDVFKELSLSEDDVQLLTTGLYETNIKVEYLDYSFNVLLAFDVNNDEMYGFWYQQTYMNDVETATKVINSLYQKLEKVYGKSDTEKGHSGRLENHLDIIDEKLSGEKVFSSVEVWNLSDDMNLSFNISTDGNSNVNIQLRYQKNAKE